MLNNTQIKRLKPKEKRYRVLDYDGLYLEIKPSGGKFWRLRFIKADGKPTMKSLGEYPGVSIEQARTERDDQKRAHDYESTTFKEAAKAWYLTQTYTSEKNKKQVWNMIDRYLIPSLGDLKMSMIKAGDILPILKGIEKRGKLEQCKRVRTKASQIFRYGIANLMCEYDPAYLVRDATEKPKPKSRAGITDKKQFKGLLVAIDQADTLNLVTKIALQLSPYVFLRSVELRSITDEMIDFKSGLLTLPAINMKKKRDHVVPLHPTAAALLKQAIGVRTEESNLVFPGFRKGRLLSENTFNQALRVLGYDGDTHVHHGFRTSFSTLAREVHRFENDLIERQLAHVQKDSTRAAYDRSYRLEDRSSMMLQWGDYLDRLRKTK